MDWSATQYLRFRDERTRPARNLLDAVPNLSLREVIDIGCGPGNSTALLVDRYPEAAVAGLDSSPAMIEQARQALPGTRFELARIDEWQPDRAYDLIFGNAVLQWLPDHRTLVPKLAGHLAPGGTIAFQMPDNLAEPSHVSMAETVAAGPWAARLEAARIRDDLLTPGGYYALLCPICSRIDIWRTIYQHVMDSPEAIVEWFKGSALRPLLGKLDESEREEFLAAYTRLITERYPRQPDGKVLLAFPRLFIVATR